MLGSHFNWPFFFFFFDKDKLYFFLIGEIQIGEQHAVKSGILQVCIASSRTGSRKWGEEMQRVWWQYLHIRLACTAQQQPVGSGRSPFIHRLSCSIDGFNHAQTLQVLEEIKRAHLNFSIQPTFTNLCLLSQRWIVYIFLFLLSLYTQRSKIITGIPEIQRIEIEWAVILLLPK